jgi:hypothetical protein
MCSEVLGLLQSRWGCFLSASYHTQLEIHVSDSGTRRENIWLWLMGFLWINRWRVQWGAVGRTEAMLHPEIDLLSLPSVLFVVECEGLRKSVFIEWEQNLLFRQPIHELWGAHDLCFGMTNSSWAFVVSAWKTIYRWRLFWKELLTTILFWVSKGAKRQSFSQFHWIFSNGRFVVAGKLGWRWNL